MRHWGVAVAKKAMAHPRISASEMRVFGTMPIVDASQATPRIHVGNVPQKMFSDKFAALNVCFADTLSGFLLRDCKLFLDARVTE